ncbi:MAG: hypothetical protein ACK443_05750 [Methylococcaceae bacterium]
MNIVNFPGYQPATDEIEANGSPDGRIAEDGRFWIGDIEWAIHTAGYVHRDIEAVEMLVPLIREYAVHRIKYMHLPLAVRTRCGRYLIRDKQFSDDMEAYGQYIYSL